MVRSTLKVGAGEIFALVQKKSPKMPYKDIVRIKGIVSWDRANVFEK